RAPRRRARRVRLSARRVRLWQDHAAQPDRRAGPPVGGRAVAEHRQAGGDVPGGRADAVADRSRQRRTGAALQRDRPRRARVALARALASAVNDGNGEAASLLLMDEPFSALDAITRDVLQGELLRVWRATGPAVVFVTHDVREAVRLGQRVVLLSSKPGRVV